MVDRRIGALRGAGVGAAILAEGLTVGACSTSNTTYEPGPTHTVTVAPTGFPSL